MATLTIFANFNIDSDERYVRMTDSFNSMRGIDAEKWVINARGEYAEKTMAFLRENLGDTLVSFSLESKKGWFHDTKKMLGAIDSDFVLFWLEDHINLVDTKLYDQILCEMKQNNSEYLEYSWWHGGKILQPYQLLTKIENESSNTFVLKKDNFLDIKKKHSIFIISMAGIFSTQLFKRLIHKTPMFMRQYPKQTPFNFEKGGEYTNWLPITMSLPKQELFANIDDDHGDPGYSLQSRGMYPIREVRPTSTSRKEKNQTVQKIKKFIPRAIYNPLITLYIKFNKLRRYLSLVLSGK